MLVAVMFVSLVVVGLHIPGLLKGEVFSSVIVSVNLGIAALTLSLVMKG